MRPNTAAVSLAEALRAAAQVLEREALPPDLHSRVLAAAEALGGPAARPQVARSPGWPQRWRGWAWPASAVLAGLLLLSLLLSLALPAPLPPQGLHDAQASGFIPVASAEAWRGAREGAMPAWLVSTEMPRDRLGLLGLPYDTGRAGESIRAELLMHGSGTVLAVRVLAQ
jgi:hypothetical protein